VTNVSTHPIVYIADLCEELAALALKLGQRDLARILEMAEIEARTRATKPSIKATPAEAKRGRTRPVEKASAKRRRKSSVNGAEIHL
jgi:hypothetical protein